MKRLFFVFAVLLFSVAPGEATNASGFRHPHRENRWLFKHRPEADSGKYFFSMTEEMSAKKLSIVALALGIFSTLFVLSGYVAIGLSFSTLSVWFFIFGIGMGIIALINSKNVFRRNNSSNRDRLRATFGVVGAIIGFNLMLPLLVLLALDIDDV